MRARSMWLPLSAILLVPTACDEPDEWYACSNTSSGHGGREGGGGAGGGSSTVSVNLSGNGGCLDPVDPNVRSAFAQFPPASPNRFGSTSAPHDGVEVVVSFSVPVDAAATNLARVSLVDDTTAAPIPSRADVDVDPTGAARVVVLRPQVQLVPGRRYALHVAAPFRAANGSSNEHASTWNSRVGSFVTPSAAAAGPRIGVFDAVLDSFDAADAIDPDAYFIEPEAEYAAGMIRANDAFTGRQTILNYCPGGSEVILNTDFTQITPCGTPPINVSGGVFEFRNVSIPARTTVRGIGSNPMVWLVNGDMTVDGTLCVDGGDGETVQTLASANFPSAGGLGACTGGNGGRGSPDATQRSPRGEAGFGPFQTPAGGGDGGRLSCTIACNRGSAGGGGSFATAGDPHYPPNVPAGQRWLETTGAGGPGCTGSAGGPLPGGEAGPRAFVDARDDNDFWGRGVDVFRQIRIGGEIVSPRGGAGGGGGGDRSANCTLGDPGFINDEKGGGGGGAGGALIVQVLGTLTIGPTGRITANGGNGGGGAPAGANTNGGGGGGGAGGMVVLMASKIEIHVHGPDPLNQATYGEGDTDFAIAADGGVGLQSAFGGVPIPSKYPFGTAATWSANAAGGFGGLGLVQLMTPAGDDADGTGTVLDDAIEFFWIDTTGTRFVVPSQRKRELLAWRGWPDGGGVFRDDQGNPVLIGDDAGDIRPTPVLLPAPWGPVSRVRSKWLDAGAKLPDERAVVDPAWAFSGTFGNDPVAPGYARYAPFGGALVWGAVFPSPVGVTGPPTVTTFGGAPAWQLDLQGTPLAGFQDDSLRTFRAQFSQGFVTLGDYRILGHSASRIWVAPAGPTPPPVQQVQILAKFYEIVTGGQPGLGPTYATPQGANVPWNNVRFGFAFHRDPANAVPGFDPNRFPPQSGTFTYDLTPFVSGQLRDYRFLQWDVTFNRTFAPNAPGNVFPGLPFGVRAFEPVPELWFLNVPFGY